jgi:hypothetical protein
MQNITPGQKLALDTGTLQGLVCPVAMGDMQHDDASSVRSR